MNEVSIKSSEGVELRFNGDQIHQTEAVFTFEDHYIRKFVVAVYSVEGGGFVPSIEYQSDCPHEKSLLYAEAIDSFEDVETFFYAFDVCELLLPTGGLTHEQKHDLLRSNKSLATKFEKLMFQFLDDLKLAVEPHGCVDRTMEPVKTGSLWGLFKTK